MKIGAWLMCVLLVPSAATAQPAPPTQLAIVFAEREVVASGVTPGGEVAWFSVSKEIHDYAARIVKREAMVEATSSGKASFPLEDPVAWQSIWVVVDVESGGFTAATPPGYPLRELVLAGDAARPGPGRADVLADAHDFLEVLLVRPKNREARPAGVWGGRVGDGGISDGDGIANRAVVLPLSRLHPVGDSAPLLPQVFLPDDVLAAINPGVMAVKVITVAPGGRP